jgi:hypothetical protein
MSNNKLNEYAYFGLACELQVLGEFNKKSEELLLLKKNLGKNIPQTRQNEILEKAIKYGKVIRSHYRRDTTLGCTKETLLNKVINQ